MMNDQEFMTEVERRKAKWKADESRDGFIEVWRQRFSYSNIPYEIVLLRYYSFNDPNKRINKSGIHAVLEYPKELQELCDAVKKLFPFSEWLYRDTLHTDQNDWTKERMVQQMHDEAKVCIDWLLNKAIPQKLKQIEDLKKLIKKVKNVEK